MSNQDNINEYFANYRARVLQAVANVIPILANETVNYALENFAKESFDNKPWEKRKDKKNVRKLLVKTGRGKRSIRVTGIRAKGFSVGTDVAYMAAHNSGATINRAASSETFVRNRKDKGKGKGRFAKGTVSGKGFSRSAYTIKLPQRRFLGASPVLAERLIKLAKTEISKAINR